MQVKTKGVHGKRLEEKNLRLSVAKSRAEKVQDVVGTCLPGECSESVASCWEPACIAHKQP